MTSQQIPAGCTPWACGWAIFARIACDLELTLTGLTPAELHYQPGPGSHSIAWLTWHLTRSHDRNMSELAGQEQLWSSEGWHARFRRAPDPTATGVGHSAADAAAVRVPDCNTLLAYHQAVLERIRHYVLRTLSEEMLDQEVYSPTLRHTATVRRRCAQ